MNCANFIQMRLHNAERRVCRWLSRELKKRRLTDSLDAATIPPEAGADITVRNLPKTPALSEREFHARIALRDEITSRSDMWTPEEMTFATLWLKGYSPQAIFNSLGIANSTGYREFNRLINTLKEACHV